MLRAKVVRPHPASTEWSDILEFIGSLETHEANPEVLDSLQKARLSLTKTLPASHPQLKLITAALAKVARSRDKDANRDESLRELAGATTGVYQDSTKCFISLQAMIEQENPPEWLRSSLSQAV